MNDTLILPSEGRWLKIKTGDTIVVSRHIACRDCNICPGLSVVIDPFLNEPICFRSKTTNTFTLVKLSELGFKKFESNRSGRFIRSLDEKYADADND